MFVPLTPGQIEGAVKGAIKGGAEATTDAFKSWWRWRKRRKWLASVTGQLNEMFANRQSAWRTLKKLATAFDEDPPFTLTRETLKGLHEQGVRRSVLDKPVYFKKNNWVLTVDANGTERPAQDNNGLYILQDGVPEGHI